MPTDNVEGERTKMNTMRVVRPSWYAVLTLVTLMAAILTGVLAARAQEGSSTYELSNLRIEYPFALEYGEPDSDSAGVTVEARWMPSYPGSVPCEITLVDQGGRVVGSQLFIVDSASAFAEFVDLRVPVRDVPSDGYVHCGQGRYEKGPGYALEFRGSREERGSLRDSNSCSVAGCDRAERRTFLDFSARWMSQADPATRSCEMTLEFTDGTTTSFGPFTVNIGGRTQEISMPLPEEVSADAPISDATVQCRALNGS